MITTKEAEEILKKEYHSDNFSYLINELLLPDFKSSKHEVTFNNQIFTRISFLGNSEDCETSVFEVYLKDGCENKRVSITQEMFKVLRSLRINNALVSFVNADEKNYRISLLTSKYEYDGDKIVKILSNPRRYSYSLGFGTKTKTAYKFLIGKGKVNNFKELLERFSVEVVNKQFYSEIAQCYSELVGGERDGKKYIRQLGLQSVVDSKKFAEFTVRLIGRVVFCWFLKEKKSENGISLIPEEVLSLTAINDNDNYYHKTLEPLFFELLNTNQKKRKDKYATEKFKQIPYLNGGLFSPHSDDLYKYDKLGQCGSYGLVNVPNSWIKHFYEVLSQYNFTVDENTSYDIELSIDPEMLGRIFENLLAEINPETGANAKKSTGSYYTPRDIVDYMVDTSLCEYLNKKTNIDTIKLNALISYAKEDDEIANFNSSEKKNIINALYNISILDPACGSGAFPIGMLQKIVYILQEVDPDANLWFDKATENVGILLKKEFEKKFNAGSLNYIRKLSVIQNSIFGIDIQPIAVEISRLRCFLSLVIEEKVDDKEENRGINPLPNLDFKFIISNSLIGLQDISQMTLFENNEHIKKLKDIRDEYFNADNERRTELKLEFKDVQQDMLLNTIANYQKQASAKYQQLSAWKPFENESTDWFDPDWMFGIKNGFDIIIGNPPYLEARNSNFSDLEKDKLQEQLKNRYGKNFDLIPRGSDLLIYFYELSLRLLKTNGINTFITQNSWLDTEYGSKFQQFLLKTTNILAIVDSDFKAFESANINTVITFFEGNQGCKKSITFARCHKCFIDYHFPIANNNSEHQSDVTIKQFNNDSDLVRSNKWGFLFNSDNELISLIQSLCRVGKKEDELYWLRVGQGLNIANDYIITSIPNYVNKENLIPYLNNDECGYYDWDTTNTYLLSNKKLNNEKIKIATQQGIKIFDEIKTKRNKPRLILPRGIGGKHFCSINTNKGYSASCVDIYFKDDKYLPNLWLFMNSTLFWLIREISGRKSLGGGMLKAEAIDLKQFPLYYEFNDIKTIREIMEETKNIKVLNAIDELNTTHHKRIDKLVYDELKIPTEMQAYIFNKFIEKYNIRVNKSKTK
ncbi:MAG: N-6 DNA methylase [Clostridia bacterium]